jgi:hypothetical protein
MPDVATTGIPPELFHGIGGFHYFGSGDPRTAEESRRRHRWVDEVLAAGYTPASIREAAETDEKYQEFLAWQARKARVIADRP